MTLKELNKLDTEAKNLRMKADIFDKNATDFERCATAQLVLATKREQTDQYGGWIYEIEYSFRHKKDICDAFSAVAARFVSPIVSATCEKLRSDARALRSEAEAIECVIRAAIGEPNEIKM